MSIRQRIERVQEHLSTLNPASWAYAFWSQVHADLMRKAVRSGA